MLQERIRNKSYSTVELGSNGKPTEEALKRRENQIIKSYEDLTNKFFTDCDTVKQATMSQQNGLLTEIRGDQKTLANTKTVSSMGDELKVSFGTYEGSKNGWNAYLSLYSDGILLYTDNFIVNYEALSGKKAPNMETELDDAVIEEYTNNVDMYNSLLTRGDPIIYFEVDYNVTSENDDKPSQYRFNFSRIRVINTVSGKVTQTSALSKVQPRAMKPEWDLREIIGIVAKEKVNSDAIMKYVAEGMDLNTAKRTREEDIIIFGEFGNTVVRIPGSKFFIGRTEVYQKVYRQVMGVNPSKFDGSYYPVENVSWYDAVCFCNKLSEKIGYTPVYSVNGITDVREWNYTPHNGDSIPGKVTQNTKANGFRLPTVEEWRYAARGGQNYTYSGSDYLYEVGWCGHNSWDRTHPVAKKKANGYGLYDMSGNVEEWCWEVDPSYAGDHSYRGGGSYCDYDENCTVAGNVYDYGDAHYQKGDIGFRIVRNAE